MSDKDKNRMKFIFKIIWVYTFIVFILDVYFTYFKAYEIDRNDIVRDIIMLVLLVQTAYVMKTTK